MKLTNEQIEQILNDAPDGWTHATEDMKYLSVTGYHVKVFNVLGVWSVPISNAEDVLLREKPISAETLREILSLRKELEQTKKELEQVINEESDGVNGVV